MQLEQKLEIEIKEFISEFCEKIGPRPPCSSNEARAAQLFYDKIKSYSDDIIIEKFQTHPQAYKASFRYPMILYILSIIFYWFSPLLSLILITLSCIILFGEVYLVKEVIDFIFPNKQSQNVISKIKAQNQIKNLIIIGSHIDSNWEFPLIKKLRYGFLIIVGINVLLNVILLIILILRTVLIIINVGIRFTEFELFMYWIFIGMIPIALTQLFFIISNHPVMGANDNLSGMAVCYEIAKNLNSPENKLKNVEVWINAYGCEEIGSKGSKFFIKEYFHQIKNARIINLDMIGYKESPLLIIKSEILSLIKMDKDLIDLVKKSALNYDINVKLSSSMAYTDSLSFSRKGLSAVSISSKPQSSKEFYYHTRDDVIEKVNLKNLVNAYKICMGIIKDLDK
ncbi:MAG: M28 family metallopeptidase [Candidatus Hodarchaeota archaeon]